MFLPVVGMFALSVAFEPTNFGFEWQERLSLLGLEENNLTGSGCALAVRTRPLRNCRGRY